MDTSLSASQVQTLRETLQMARDVLHDEGYENAAIQCRIALRILNEKHEAEYD